MNNIESGIRWNRSQISLSGNLFYMDFVDEIAPIGEVLAFGVQKRENIASSSRYGLEVEWLAILKPMASGFEGGDERKGSTRRKKGMVLSWEGNLTWMKGNITSFSTPDGTTYTDRSPIFSPEWMVNQALMLDVSTHWSLRVEGRYVSESFMELTNNPAFTVPAYRVMNAQLMWKGSRMDIRFDAYNLLDVPYYSLGNPVDIDFDGTNDEPGYLVNAGRSFLISTRFTF